MPRVGVESKILASEREKTVHALDPAATVIGKMYYRAYLKSRDW
jgi:hypothetical protein